MKGSNRFLGVAVGIALGLGLLLATPAKADRCLADDDIVEGSECVGFDCVCGEAFGFDTQRYKENNLRVHFDDTSNSASFPRNDWRIVINDSSNGGAEYFAVEDSTSGRQVFRIEARARANALYVDDGGRIGIGTSTPVVRTHLKDGNTPTLRLEQDGSSGFTAQTWDLAGNEANFFIRDATGGSTLPFRIRPGAPTSAVDIHSSRVGIFSSSPEAPLDVDLTGTSITPPPSNAVLRLARSGPLALQLNDTGDAATFWNFATANNDNEFRISRSGTGAVEMTLFSSGNLTIRGALTTTGCTGCGADYVFEPDYPLMPLDELAAFIERERHLPNVPSAAEIEGNLNMTEMQLRLLEKVEELTLYTLAQEETIRELRTRLERLEGSAP